MNKLKRVTIDTNPDTCNFQCKMCDTHSRYNKNPKKRKDMPLELLERCLNEAKESGVEEIIPTTMGEPTLYKYFNNIVRFCKQHNIKLNLTTNGSQLFKKYDDIYIKNELLEVLSDIKISLNSINPKINEYIMEKSNTMEILKHIKQLCSLRDKHKTKVSITLQMTFMRTNIDEILPLIEHAIQIGINRVKGHHLWITHKELENEALHNDRQWIARWNELIKKIDSYRQKITLENFNAIGNADKDNIVKSCPFLGKELWLNYQGDISVCCAPDAERKELGDFGNIKETSLKQVLDSKQYGELIRIYQTKEVCKKCLLKK